MEDEKIEDNLKLLEKKMHAKKSILKEVLRTISTENGRNESAKSRKYIRDMLNCEISIPATENSCCSFEIIESFGFEMHVVTRIRISNKLPDSQIKLKTSSRDCTTRWIVFEDENSVSSLPAVANSSSAVLLVVLPFSAFFHSDHVSVIVQCQEVPSGSRLLNPVFHSVIGQNQSPEPLKQATFSFPIDMNKASEELDLKSIEFCDEQKSIKIVQSLFAVFASLPIPKSVDVSSFRREFPRFSCIDFDTWRLFAGTERFETVFVYISTDEENKKCNVLAKTTQTSKTFLQVLNRKCSKVD